MTDSQLIDELGGPAAVAGLLKYDKHKGGIQRVHNWRSRGIPAAIKVLRPDLFLRLDLIAQPAPTGAQPIKPVESEAHDGA